MIQISHCTPQFMNTYLLPCPFSLPAILLCSPAAPTCHPHYLCRIFSYLVQRDTLVGKDRLRQVLTFPAGLSLTLGLCCRRCLCRQQPLVWCRILTLTTFFIILPCFPLCFSPGASLLQAVTVPACCQGLLPLTFMPPPCPLAALTCGL